MDTQTLIADAERRAVAAGLSVDEFCKDAGIARSTWQRWKSGATEPTMRTWRRVEESLVRAETETPAAAGSEEGKAA